MQSVLDKARQLRKEGKARQAITILKEYVDEHPEEAKVWRLIGDCFHDLKKWKRMLRINF